MPDTIKLGKLVKIRGKEGEMICHFEIDNPENYNNLEFIHVEINQRLIPFRIISLEITGDHARISLKDIDNPEAAQELIKRNVYISIADLPRLPDKELYPHEIVGYKICDTEKGEIGTVKDILHKPEQPLLQVSHQGKELLIPLAAELIVEISKEKRCIIIDLPEGLIDLNLK
jgi:16S rRNA processing protein RimM